MTGLGISRFCQSVAAATTHAELSYQRKRGRGLCLQRGKVVWRQYRRGRVAGVWTSCRLTTFVICLTQHPIQLRTPPVPRLATLEIDAASQVATSRLVELTVKFGLSFSSLPKKFRSYKFHSIDNIGTPMIISGEEIHELCQYYVQMPCHYVRPEQTEDTFGSMSSASSK